MNFDYWLCFYRKTFLTEHSSILSYRVLSLTLPSSPLSKLGRQPSWRPGDGNFQPWPPCRIATEKEWHEVRHCLRCQVSWLSNQHSTASVGREPSVGHKLWEELQTLILGTLVVSQHSNTVDTVGFTYKT